MSSSLSASLPCFHLTSTSPHCPHPYPHRAPWRHALNSQLQPTALSREGSKRMMIPNCSCGFRRLELQLWGWLECFFLERTSHVSQRVKGRATPTREQWAQDRSCSFMAESHRLEVTQLTHKRGLSLKDVLVLCHRMLLL